MGDLIAFFVIQIAIIPVGMYVSERPMNRLPDSKTVGWSLAAAGLIYASVMLLWLFSGQAPEFSLTSLGVLAVVNLVGGALVLARYALRYR